MSDNNDNKYLTLDDMNYFWMENGAPCFIGNSWDVVDDICETIESFGFQIYYLICDKETSKTVQAKNDKGVMVPTEVYEYTPAIFKVVNNFTGRAVMPATESFGNSFASTQEVATYSMPPIPRVIVDKLDEFFRLVDAQHHTESIVILTYDTTKEGSDGWGVLVPEQTNTSVHCKYDADSIAALKPDHVMIVGSVHSHPDMPAYASGTDHEDQADFDGIHITYGWQKSVNNGATQYHIELQIGGSSFTLKPEDVFQTYSITKDPDPEVIEWSSKVKKAAPLYTGGTATTQYTTHGLKTPAALQETRSYPTTPGTSSFQRSDLLSKIDNVEKDAIVAFEVDDKLPPGDCIVCTFALTQADVNSGYCMTCDTPIITTDMGQYDIILYLNHYCKVRQLDPNVAYYVYCTDENPTGAFLINVKPNGQSPEDLTEDPIAIANLDSQEVLEYTLCCDLPVSMIEACTCPVTVLEENIFHFDNAHSKVDIYDMSTKCADCNNYYQTSCPAFKNAIVDYMTNNKIVTHVFEPCDAFIDYRSVQDTMEASYYRGYYD